MALKDNIALKINNKLSPFLIPYEIDASSPVQEPEPQPEPPPVVVEPERYYIIKGGARANKTGMLRNDNEVWNGYYRIKVTSSTGLSTYCSSYKEKLENWTYLCYRIQAMYTDTYNPMYIKFTGDKSGMNKRYIYPSTAIQTGKLKIPVLSEKPYYIGFILPSDSEIKIYDLWLER